MSGTQGSQAPKQEQRPSVSAALDKLKTFARTSPMIDAVREAIDAMQGEIADTRRTVGKLSFELAKAQRRISDIVSVVYGSEAHDNVRAAFPEGIAVRISEMLSVVYGDEIQEHILKLFPEGITAGLTRELMETQDALDKLQGQLGGEAGKLATLDSRMGRHGNELTEVQLILQNAFGHDFERAKAMGADNFEWSKTLLLSQLCSEYVTVESVRELAVRRGPVTIKHALQDFTQPVNVKMALESKYLQEGQWLNTGLKRKIELNSQSITQRAQYFLDNIDFEALVMDMHKDTVTI